jgi:hypothetical protein
MAHVIRLRRTPFEQQAKARGYESQSAQARAIGVHVSIHNRALHGASRALSGPYVIGVMRLLGDEGVQRFLDEMFDVGTDDEEAIAS